MYELKDEITKHKNIVYLNQMLMQERTIIKRTNTSTSIQRKKKQSFGSQNIDLKEIVFAPEGYESIAYMLYLLIVPYIVGAICLFFVVAGGNFDNFMLLDTSAFLIVWAIGYEIVAVVALSWIVLLYLQYEEPERFY